MAGGWRTWDRFFVLLQAMLQILRPQIGQLLQAVYAALKQFIEGTTAATVKTFGKILMSDFRREVCVAAPHPTWRHCGAFRGAGHTSAKPDPRARLRTHRPTVSGATAARHGRRRARRAASRDGGARRSEAPPAMQAPLGHLRRRLLPRGVGSRPIARPLCGGVSVVPIEKRA